VLRETTSRGLCGLVCPSRTSNHQREGEGYCVKGGWGGEGERKRERALGLLLCHGPVCVLPLPTLDNMKHSLFRKDRTVLGHKVCVPIIFNQTPAGRRNMSRPRPTAIIGSVGNPFDRVWPPTTPGHLQPIFSYIDSPPPPLYVCMYMSVGVSLLLLEFN
jgi:hypothetical protein